MNFYAGAEEKN